MNIQSTGGPSQIAQLLQSGSAANRGGPSPAMGGGQPPSQFASITNDQGQSLLDIRDELQSAVKDAVQSSEGTDIRSAVKNALDSTLEANGFDPAEVKGAMKEAGLGPMSRPGGPGGGPGGQFSGQFAQRLGGQPFSGAAGGFDPMSIISGGGSEQDLVQSFLQQFREGSNLDLEG